MNKTRIQYFIFFLTIILLGILSRKISVIPLCIGDFLYAVMVYLLIRIFLTNQKATHIIVLALMLCYSIEFFQLYQAEWIIQLRQTLFGRYVLGQEFLWADIFAYTIGIIFTFLIEKIILKYSTYETRFRFK